VTEIIQRVLVPPAGISSRIAGLFYAQLEDQSRRLKEQTRGATPEELAWQPAPSMNTIGMLLAHIAGVEVGWIQTGVHGAQKWEVEKVLDRPYAEYGMPLKPGAAPPAALAGRDLAYFDDLLARARAFTFAALAPLGDADMARTFRVPAHWKPDTEFEGTVEWPLYHILEHLAGHYGQVNLLRHHYRLQHAKV
jgi:hypothetical protein